MKAVNDGWGAQDWIGVGGPAMRDEGLAGATDMESLTRLRIQAPRLRLSRACRALQTVWLKR